MYLVLGGWLVAVDFNVNSLSQKSDKLNGAERKLPDRVYFRSGT
jgi:hypothetical protein